MDCAVDKHASNYSGGDEGLRAFVIIHLLYITTTDNENILF